MSDQQSCNTKFSILSSISKHGLTKNSITYKYEVDMYF